VGAKPMNIAWHAASALPLLAIDQPWAALGAVAPDVTWIANEIRFRRSDCSTWNIWIPTVPNRHIVPYKIAHSLFTVALVALFGFVWPEIWAFCVGWVLHLALDWPTHGGRMRQQPLYPFAWRFPWVLRAYR